MVETKNPAVPLDLLLLIVLAPAHLWFNPTSSALAVGLLVIYTLVSFLSPRLPDELDAPRRRHRFLFLLRIFVVLFFVLMAAILPAGIQIIARLEQGPATNAHDGLLQTEIAMEFLLDGKNPYRENYFGTVMEEWRGGEPPWTPTLGPLYHNAYLPGLFVLPLPLYVLSQSLLGWYDQRLFYLATFAAFLLFLVPSVPKQRHKLAALLATGLNFLFPYFVAEGRNDIVILLFLMITTFLLAKGHTRLASAVLGLAVASKHLAWFFVPFYYIFLMPDGVSRSSVRSVIGQTWPLVITSALLVGPFLLWDAPAFIDDTLLYLTGSTEHSWPIRGIGFSQLLVAAGLLDVNNTSFPFLVLEALAGIPLFWLLLQYQRHENSLRVLWLNFALFSMVVVYFSRFLHDSYVVFILQALAIAAFLPPVRWLESHHRYERQA
jgi:hypothetical protein